MSKSYVSKILSTFTFNLIQTNPTTEFNPQKHQNKYSKNYPLTFNTIKLSQPPSNTKKLPQTALQPSSTPKGYNR